MYSRNAFVQASQWQVQPAAAKKNSLLSSMTPSALYLRVILQAAVERDFAGARARTEPRHAPDQHRVAFGIALQPVGMFAGDLATLEFGRQAEGHHRGVKHDAIAGGAVGGDAVGELLFRQLVGGCGDRVMRVGRLNDDRVEAEFFFEARGAVLDVGERDERGVAVGLKNVGFAEPLFLRWRRGGEGEVGRKSVNGRLVLSAGRRNVVEV